jgi:hypothetical protein
VVRGRLLALSTPAGKRGWFWEEWVSSRPWRRVRATAGECSRISPEFLREEREALGDRWYNQEYFCSFEELIGSLFRQEDIDRALAGDVAPLFGS